MPSVPVLPRYPTLQRALRPTAFSIVLALAGCGSAETDSTPTTGVGPDTSGAGAVPVPSSTVPTVTDTQGPTATAAPSSSVGIDGATMAPGSGVVTPTMVSTVPATVPATMAGDTPGAGDVPMTPTVGNDGMPSDGETAPDDGPTADGSLAPNPSAGCGIVGPETGSAQSPLIVSGHQYYVKLPAGYDPNTPYVGLFMFNPTNNPIDWAEQNAGFESNGAAEAAIRIYPHPANPAAGWGASDVSFFEPLYDNIVVGYCVDQARMFAAGESSGGDFSSILGCEFADKLRAVGPCATKPVGSYPLNVAQRSCTGQVTAVVIHGANDSVVGPENGPLTRDFYTELNHCGTATEPVAGYTDSLSNCVQYQGCDDGFPVFWCQHNDPEYSNTNHGWPRFAADMLWGLFSSY